MENLFHSLSCVLIGDNDLSKTLAADYYNHLLESQGMADLLNAFHAVLKTDPDDIAAEVRTKLLVNDGYKALIKKIIHLWYFGKLPDMTTLAGKHHYFHYEAIVWKVIHAHPPGLTDGYYGHWSYKPEL